MIWKIYIWFCVFCFIYLITTAILMDIVMKCEYPEFFNGRNRNWAKVIWTVLQVAIYSVIPVFNIGMVLTMAFNSDEIYEKTVISLKERNK